MKSFPKKLLYLYLQLTLTNVCHNLQKKLQGYLFFLSVKESFGTHYMNHCKSNKPLKLKLGV
jgi:hypothetical protein